MGLYILSTEVGKKLGGKRKVVEKGGFESKKAAYDAGAFAYNDWKHGNIGITCDNTLLKDFLQNRLKKVFALNVKPTTMQSYISFKGKAIVPYLGNIPLQEMTSAVWDNRMRSLQGIGYSKGSLSDIHSLIHHALDYAVYPAELISSNPANYIKVPKKAPTNIVKRHIITPEKLNELLEENPFGTP